MTNKAKRNVHAVLAFGFVLLALTNIYYSVHDYLAFRQTASEDKFTLAVLWATVALSMITNAWSSIEKVKELTQE